jgi:SecD/SecF fusion protein
VIFFNLKFKIMKTYFLFVVIISLVFSFGGCTMKDNFEYKATIVPESKSSVTLNDMNSAAEIISKRLKNSPGIQNEDMKLDVTENQISLTLSKTDTSKILSIKKIITGYARLEFWETYENSEITGYLTKANNLLREMKVVPEVKNSGIQDVSVSQNPLFGVLRPMVTENGDPLPSCLIGLASETDTAKVDRYLQIPQVKDLFPRDIRFLWSHNPHKYGPAQGLYELHAIKVTSQDGKAPLDGSVISSARAVTGKSSSDIKIDLTMTAEGSIRWAKITRENIKRCIAVVLNGYVRSYPRVQAEITGRNTEITGNFTKEEANDLVNIFKSGELPFELKIEKEQIIKSQ